MTETTWTWARLDARGLDLVQEAERTLGADVVLVYAEGDPGASDSIRASLRPATLDTSQLECLQGLEAQVGGIAVAYQRA